MAGTGRRERRDGRRRVGWGSHHGINGRRDVGSRTAARSGLPPVCNGRCSISRRDRRVAQCTRMPDARTSLRLTRRTSDPPSPAFGDKSQNGTHLAARSFGPHLRLYACCSTAPSTAARLTKYPIPNGLPTPTPKSQLPTPNSHLPPPKPTCTEGPQPRGI